jgi:hypothetical protein
MLLKPALCSLAAFFGSRMIFSALFDFQGNLLKFLVFSTVFGVIFTAGLILSKTIKFSEFKILQYGKKRLKCLPFGHSYSKIIANSLICERRLKWLLI